MKNTTRIAVAALAALASGAAAAERCAALDQSYWAKSQWLSVPDAPVFDGVAENGTLSAPGESWFAAEIENVKEVKSVKWMTAGLGVYEIYANAERIEDDFLKPGFTHNKKTKYAFTYDITDCVRKAPGERNVFSAEVSAGWWREKICTPHHTKGYAGTKSAFRGVLEYVYADGTVQVFGTNVDDWRAGVLGPVKRASIFDGEFYDAREAPGYARLSELKAPERNFEFTGRILPTAGAEVCLRGDLALAPVSAYAWEGVDGASEEAFGTVRKVRDFDPAGEIEVLPGQTVIVDFGQNSAAVPSFLFTADKGVTLTAKPAEMLNDGNGAKSRRCDGPEGSVYRESLRAGSLYSRWLEYTFAGAGGIEEYMPRFTFFGYRYLSITATGPVKIVKLASIPVTSLTEAMERGSIKTGDEDVNRLFSNVLWGERSNYLSVPTDCPQRNERLGWTADTQVFAETALFNADVSAFLRKWMRDMRDSQHDDGSFPSVAPFAQYGNEGHRFGWADAGVIVPYTVWKFTGDTAVIRENFEAMDRFMDMVESTEYRNGTDARGWPLGQYADWLSFEDFEPRGDTAYVGNRKTLPNGTRNRVKDDAVVYWNFLSGCYWHWDALMMSEMAAALGCEKSAARYAAMAKKAMEYLRREYVDPEDGLLHRKFRDLQGAALFALKFGILEKPEAVAATKEAYLKSVAEHDGCNMTGFLGTSIIMDTLTENGMAETAYSLLLNHKCPSWLYSVDQGATTCWERWNSYTKADGFGEVSMNSFNHYAYGAVMGWVYKTVCGIAADPKSPGFRNIIMKPVPDRRLGSVEAEFRAPTGLVKSAWKYEGADWAWTFTVPEGATADVTLPGETESKRYTAGTYTVAKTLD